MRVLSCSSPYGKGGVGRHFAQLVEESRSANCLGHYFALSFAEGDQGRATPISLWPYAPYARYTPLRILPALDNYVRREVYDRRVAAQLPRSGTSFMAFAGEALHSFRRARALGYEHLELVVPNSHVDNVMRLHARAARETGFADTWLNDRQRRKVHREYEAADRIYVHSTYVAQTLRDAGLPAHKLRRTYLAPAARFCPPARRSPDGPFRIAYVGRLDGTKGVPLLLDAFRQLPFSDVELTLVGGWSSRAMRKHIQAELRQDARIRQFSGDPLPVLQAADVFVHPSYEDGFGYAPAEALQCGVPVITTADAGVKEYVSDGVNGYVVPTGDTAAIVERLIDIARRPLAATTPLATFSPPVERPSPLSFSTS